MKRLSMSKADIINALVDGKVIRETCGIWNDPKKSGTICKTPEDIMSFYKWAYVVDVYEGLSEGIDYDLVGASGGDMF